MYRIAVNHLKDCRTHQFANAPFSFEMYGADIVDERAKDVPDLSEGVDRGMLARELKLSCTNVMLQCLDADSRCAYVLGTMFKVDSSTAADVLELCGHVQATVKENFGVDLEMEVRRWGEF